VRRISGVRWKSLVCRVDILMRFRWIWRISIQSNIQSWRLSFAPGVTLVTDAEEVIVTAHVESETQQRAVLKRQKPKSWSVRAPRVLWVW